MFEYLEQLPYQPQIRDLGKENGCSEEWLLFLILQSPKAKKGKPETETAESAESPVVSNLFKVLDKIPYLYSIPYIF